MIVLPEVEEEPGLNEYPVFYWNHVGLEMNRITHSLGGPQGGPTMSSRALGLLHLAMHDAYFIALGHDESSDPPTYLSKGNPAAKSQGHFAHLVAEADRLYANGGSSIVSGNLDNANRALSGAAVTMLDILYSGNHPNISLIASDTLTRSLSRMIASYQPQIDILHPAHALGSMVAAQIFDLLGVKPGQPGADAGRYEPKPGPYKFRDEPVTPVRPVPLDPNDPSRGDVAVRVYHGPVYGLTVADFAVTKPDEHRIANPPDPSTAEYVEALREVVRLGGAPALPMTKRTAEQTAVGYFWAYDGANLIGTPPRLYNQIVRAITWKYKLTSGGTEAARLRNTSDFVRVMALTNVAMADAGKFAWREKYRFELWRPLSGVREHVDHSSGSATADTDAFWLTLGAPETNTDRVSFKPPFPAYPSGHATFGAAAFQILRLHYACRESTPPCDLDALLSDGYQTPDAIAFHFVSEELNGVSRDLRQPYDPRKPIEDQQGTVRTKVRREFASLWDAIFENAFSRIYLGVHWRYDAAAATDIYVKGVGDEHDSLKSPANMKYADVWHPGRLTGRFPVGGVPLGIGIANDIFSNRMRIPGGATLGGVAPSAATEAASKRSNTTYRQAN